VLTRRSIVGHVRDDLWDGLLLAAAMLLTGWMPHEERVSFRGIGLCIIFVVGIVCGIVWWISL
jgi:hypothetical protein